MQDDTSSNNASSGSFKEAMTFLGAFGELIDKVTAAKQANPDPEDNSDMRRSIRMIWADNKDKIKQEFPEVMHLDVEPAHGYLFALMEDEALDKMPVSRLKSIKRYLYQSANYKMIFDNYSHFLNNQTEHQIII